MQIANAVFYVKTTLFCLNCGTMRRWIPANPLYRTGAQADSSDGVSVISLSAEQMDAQTVGVYGNPEGDLHVTKIGL